MKKVGEEVGFFLYRYLSLETDPLTEPVGHQFDWAHFRTIKLLESVSLHSTTQGLQEWTVIPIFSLVLGTGIQGFILGQ